MTAPTTAAPHAAPKRPPRPDVPAAGPVTAADSTGPARAVARLVAVTCSLSIGRAGDLWVHRVFHRGTTP